MAGLRTLLQYTTTSATPLNYDTLRIWNSTNTNDASNGGRCCLWTVPAGVNWFAVEMWGGGGGGSGACCCFSGVPGGSGSYARRIISGFAPGAEYTLCAAGSTGCSQFFCLGCAGFPSFVAVNGGAVQVCASGGTCGRGFCQFMNGCTQQGCAQQQCGAFIGTMGICGTTGSAKGSPMCAGTSYQFMPSAPFTFGSNRGTRDACSGFCGGCCQGGFAHFPGGGGATATAHTSTQFCGAAGAAGMIQIFYPVIT